MNPAYDFHDRVAVVTGAGAGMGLATAQAFADAGAAVVLADSNEQTLRGVTAELTSAGHHALGCRLRRDRRGAGRRTRRTRRGDLRPTRLRVQQRRHPGSADRRRRRTGRHLQPRERGQPARRLGVHEARAASDAGARKRRHRQLLLARRPGWAAGPRRLSRLQARRPRPHQERGARIRTTRDPHQCDLPDQAAGAPEASAPSPSPSPSSRDEEANSSEGTPIRITFGDTELTARLDDNATARDLAAQLPLTLTFRDHNNVEKTAPLPRELSPEGAPEGHDPAAGDIGYWAPDGDLVFYYDSDAPLFNGIVRIGEFDGEMDAIERLSEDFSVTIQRTEA